MELKITRTVTRGQAADLAAGMELAVVSIENVKKQHVPRDANLVRVLSRYRALARKFRRCAK